ncbi:MULTISPECIES: hypothetical protein [Kosakonia]|uniref:hypothetical protein n=1 Tax=Kosakonia TaxID=1330547 RepID=UPI00158539AB|nr:MULTISPECIES: hypothetical protein [Kosakonia]MCL6745972.1 hypothetical protein [Kosakonia sp. R1.Fl]MDZ7321200.1 hypothetical protein [Kosakonia sacchari]NUL35325.1 hypothetical protein [Kosakonia sacchari]
MKHFLFMFIVLACAGLNGCASYNEHIRACDGHDVSTMHLAFDYLPIGAAIDNGACAVSSKGSASASGK